VTASERIERATHEAGHAIVALAVGIGVARVSIRGDRDNNGACEVGDTGSLEAKAMTRLAGREALSLSGLPVTHCGRDLREARSYAVELVGEADADRVLEELRAKTNTLLRDWDRWRELGDVTIALLERETLTGSELGSVLYSARLRSARAA
jgi:ATP-dependent Zn protease